MADDYRILIGLGADAGDLFATLREADQMVDKITGKWRQGFDLTGVKDGAKGISRTLGNIGRGADKAADGLKHLREEIEPSLGPLKKLQEVTKQVDLTGIKGGAKGLSTMLGNIGKGSDKAADGLKKLREEVQPTLRPLKQLRELTELLAEDTKQMSAAMRDYLKVMLLIQRKQKRLEDATKKLWKETKRLLDEVKRGKPVYERTAKAQDRLRRSSGSLLSSLSRQLAAIGGLYAAYRGLAAIVETSLGFDRLDIALEQATGSAEAAAVEQSFLSDQINRLGLAVQPASEGFIKFTAATRESALEGEATRQIWTGLAEAGAALQLSSDQTSGSLLALTQIASKNRVSMEEINQLGERIPGSLNIAARAVGVTTRELLKMVESGKILAEDFLPLFGHQLREEFGGNLERALNSPQAQFNRLQNTFLMLADTAGDELLPRLADLAGTLARFGQDPSTINFFRSLGEILGATAGFLQGVTVALPLARSIFADFTAGVLELLADASSAVIHFFVDAEESIEGFMRSTAERSRSFFESFSFLDISGATREVLDDFISSLDAGAEARNEARDQSRAFAESLSADLQAMADVHREVAQEQFDLHERLKEGAEVGKEFADATRLTAEEVDQLREKISAAASGSEKAVEALRKRTSDLVLATKRNLELAKAYDIGHHAVQRVTTAHEVESRALKLVKGDAEALTDEIRKLAAANLESERILAGSQALASIREQIEEHHRLIDAYQDELIAGDATADYLGREKALREQLTKVSATQREEVSRLTREMKALAAVEQSEVSLSIATASGGDAAALVEAAMQGAEAYRRLVEEMQVAGEVAQATEGDLRNLASIQIEVTALQQERSELLTVFPEAIVDGINAEIDALIEHSRRLEENINLTKEQVRQKLVNERISAAAGGLQQQIDEIRVYQDALKNASLKQKLFGTATLEAGKALFIYQEMLKLGITSTEGLTKEQEEAVAKIREMAGELFDLENASQQVTSLGDKFQALGGILANVFDGIDSNIANTIRGLSQAVGAFQAMAQAKESGDRVGGAVAGAQYGGAFADMTISSGIFEGDRGIGRYGGQLSGDYAREGGQIGGAIGGLFGPVVGAWLGAIGTVVGGLIKRGADEALVSFKQFGSDLTASFDLIEGGLGPAAEEFASGVLGMVTQIETLIGAELTTGEFGFKLRDDVITVFINGLRRDFEEMEDAILFTIDEILRTASFGEGVGEKLKTVLRYGTIESPEELEYLISAAQALDRGSLAARPYADALSEINRRFRQDATLLKEHGLTMADAIQLQTMRTQAIRDEIMASELAIAGVTNYAEQIRAATAAFEDYNFGVSQQEQAIRDEIAAREAALPSLREQAANAKDLSEVAGDLSLGIDGLVGGMGMLAGTGRDAVATLANTERELEQLKESLAELPGAIDEQALRDKVNQVGLDAFGSLLDLVRQVRGEQYMAAEEQRMATELYALQLAHQVLATRNLLATAELLPAATRAMLEQIVGEADQILAGISSGRLSLPRRSGGGRSSGDGGAAQREARRAELRREFGELAALIADVPETVLQINDSFRQFHETLAEAARLGLPQDLIDEARRNNVLLAEEALLAPIRETMDAINLSDAERDFRELSARYEEALQGAFAVAVEKAEAFGISFEEAFAPLRDEISAAFATELGDGLGKEIERLLAAGDAEGLRELSDAWAEMLGSLSPDLLAAIEDLIPGIADQFGEAFEQIRANTLDSLASDLGLDDDNSIADRVQGIRDRVADAVEALEAATASEEELARAREMGQQAIDNLIADELDRFRALAGIDQPGNDPVDRFRVLQDGLTELIAGLEAAGAPAEALAEALDIFAQGAERLRDSELDRLAGTLGVERSGGGDTISDRVAAADAALEATLLNLEEMGASEAQLAEARSLHGEAIRQLRLEHDELIQTWLNANKTQSPYIDRLNELAESTSQARKDAISLATSVMDLGRRLREIDEASREARLAIGRDLAGALQDFGVEIPGFEEGMARAQHAMLVASVTAFAASVSVEDFAATFGMTFGELMGQLDAALEDQLKEIQNRSASTSFSVDFTPIEDGLSDLAKKFKEVQANVNAFIAAVDDLGTESGLVRELRDFRSSYQEVLDQVMELPEFMRDDLLPQLEDAYARGFQAIIDKAKEPLRNLLDELNGGPAAGIASRDQLAAQRQLVQDLEARAAAGDLSALEQLETEARRLLELNDLVNAGGRAGGAIRDEVRAIIERTLGLEFSPDDIDLDTPDIGVNDLIAAPVELAARDLIVAPLSVDQILEGLFGTPGSARGDGILVPIPPDRVYSSAAEPRRTGRPERQRRSRRYATAPLPYERVRERPERGRRAVGSLDVPGGAPVLHLPPPPPPALPTQGGGHGQSYSERERARREEEALRKELQALREAMEEQAREQKERDEELLGLLTEGIPVSDQETREMLENIIDQGGGR